jgi:hypothetical protein
MRWPFAVLALSAVLSSAAAGAELTVVPNGSSGCAVLIEGGGGVMEDPADFIETQVPPDALDVAVAAAASGGASFPGLYLGSFQYSCTLPGRDTSSTAP